MKIRIGTRKSELALWQAHLIARNLEAYGHETEIVKVVSFGDLEKDLPIHKLGDKGVFTKALDHALMMDSIDLAVHSLKDVPTVLDDDLILAAVPRRGNPYDVLVKPLKPLRSIEERTLATGSIRRSAMWKHRFPDDTIVGLRGNVPTRLEKVDKNKWYGGIFAYAGLDRLGLPFRINTVLEWMTPAPAQGALGIICKNDPQILKALYKLNHGDSRFCVDIERSFLNTLGVGCSSAVGGFASIDDDTLTFTGEVLSVDGSRKISISKSIALEDAVGDLGDDFAHEILSNGADLLIDSATTNG